MVGTRVCGPLHNSTLWPSATPEKLAPSTIAVTQGAGKVRHGVVGEARRGNQRRAKKEPKCGQTLKMPLGYRRQARFLIFKGVLRKQTHVHTYTCCWFSSWVSPRCRRAMRPAPERNPRIVLRPRKNHHRLPKARSLTWSARRQRRERQRQRQRHLLGRQGAELRPPTKRSANYRGDGMSALQQGERKNQNIHRQVHCASFALCTRALYCGSAGCSWRAHSDP